MIVAGPVFFIARAGRTTAGRSGPCGSVHRDVDDQGAMVRESQQRRPAGHHPTPRAAQQNVIELTVGLHHRERRMFGQGPVTGDGSRFGAGMFRSPISTTGSPNTARSRRTRPSCHRPHPGTKDRWVLATTSGPCGVWKVPITTVRGSSCTTITLRGPGNHIGNLIGISVVAAPASCRGVAGQQGDPVRGALRRFPTGGRDPGRSRRAGQGRRELLGLGAHRVGGHSGQVGQVRALLQSIDFLQTQHVGIQGADRVGQPVQPNGAILGRSTVQNVERRQPHSRKVPT